MSCLSWPHLEKDFKSVSAINEGAPGKAFTRSSLFLYHLEQIEFQIVRLRNIPQNGMVRGLLAGLDLAQLHPVGALGGDDTFGKITLCFHALPSFIESRPASRCAPSAVVFFIDDRFFTEDSISYLSEFGKS